MLDWNALYMLFIAKYPSKNYKKLFKNKNNTFQANKYPCKHYIPLENLEPKLAAISCLIRLTLTGENEND